MPKTTKKNRKNGLLFEKKRKPKKKDDRRGRHTKESRRLKQEEINRFLNNLATISLCDNCTGSSFVPTVDGDANVCTTCGMVTRARIIEGCTDVLLDFYGSAPYLHRNYFAERLLQARGKEPSFTTTEENKINVVWSMLHDQDRVRFGNSAGSYSKYRYRQILRTLNIMEPDQGWKKKLERWWQSREVIYGPDNTWNTLDDYHSYMLKVLFDPIGSCFDEHFRKKTPGRHNIPKLNVLVLILLYNISEDALVKYGWYFLSKNIIRPTKSVLENYKRAKHIIHKVNEDFINRLIRPDVRKESYQWLQKHKYVVPELDYLVSLATDSKEGHHCMLQHLKHGSLLYDRPIYIQDH